MKKMKEKLLNMYDEQRKEEKEKRKNQIKLETVSITIQGTIEFDVTLPDDS